MIIGYYPGSTAGEEERGVGSHTARVNNQLHISFQTFNLSINIKKAASLWKQPLTFLEIQSA